MSDLNQKALEAAEEAYVDGQASEGIEWLTGEQQHMRGLEAAISAYLHATAYKPVPRGGVEIDWHAACTPSATTVPQGGKE